MLGYSRKYTHLMEPRKRIWDKELNVRISRNEYAGEVVNAFTSKIVNRARSRLVSDLGWYNVCSEESHFFTRKFGIQARAETIGDLGVDKIVLKLNM